MGLGTWLEMLQCMIIGKFDLNMGLGLTVRDRLIQKFMSFIKIIFTLTNVNGQHVDEPTLVKYRQ
jgi:hypothetical protein